AKVAHTAKEKQGIEKAPESTGVIRMGDLADTIRAVPPVTDITHGEGEHRHGNDSKEDSKNPQKPVHMGSVDQELDNKLQGAGAETLSSLKPSTSAADNSIDNQNASSVVPNNRSPHTSEVLNAAPLLNKFSGLNDEEIAAVYEATPAEFDESGHYSDPEDE